MDFRQEYKKSAEIMNPSAEAIERMKSNILAKAQQPAKKTFPFKQVAYAGSALAACAVIAVAAANVMPSLTAKNEIAQDATNSECAVYVAADCDKSADMMADSAVSENIQYSDEYADAATDGGSIPTSGSNNAPIITTTAPATTTVVFQDEPEIFDVSVSDSVNSDDAADTATEADIPDISDVPFEGSNTGAQPETVVTQPVTLEMGDDTSTCIIGNKEYVLIPPERLTQLVFPEIADIVEFPSADGNTYTVFDYEDFVQILCGDVLFGVYSTPEMFDVVADPADLWTTSTSTESDTATVPDIDEEFIFEMSTDGDVIVLNDVTYVLIDDGTSPPAGTDVNCFNMFLPDGTEYWFDFYGETYFVLTQNNVCQGGYIRQ